MIESGVLGFWLILIKDKQMEYEQEYGNYWLFHIGLFSKSSF